MFSKKFIGAFIICVLFISAAFYADAFYNWYHGQIDAHDEGWIDYGKKNAQDTCEASIYIEKFSSFWPYVDTYERATAKTAEFDSWGNQNVGSYGIWIRITAVDNGGTYTGADTFHNRKGKKRWFVSPGEVTVQARASVSPMLDSSTGTVEDSF